MTSTMHPEILTPTQLEVLRRVAPVATAEGFYLSGGTAVALHLGHRRSIDLDWFSPVDFDPEPLVHTLRQRVPDIEVRSQADGTLHAVEAGVMISFLRYRYPFVEPLIEWTEPKLRLGSVPDLAAMKLAAIGNRGARKDFVDLFALGGTGLTLAEMLRLYQRRFGVEDVAHVVFSLSYFEDAEREEMPEMLWPVGWDEIKSTVRGWVAAL